MVATRSNAGKRLVTVALIAGFALGSQCGCGASRSESGSKPGHPAAGQAGGGVLYESASTYLDAPSMGQACTPAKAVYRSGLELWQAGLGKAIPGSVDFSRRMVAQDKECEGDCRLLAMQPAESTAPPEGSEGAPAGPDEGQGWIRVQVVLPDPCCVGPWPGDEFLEACHAVRYAVLAILPDSDLPVCFTYRTEICVAM